MLPFSIVMLLAAGLAPSRPAVECVAVTGQHILKSPAADLVFSGRVVEYTFTADAAYRATFDVDRVWKGNVPKRIDIHVWQLQAEMPRYAKGGDYVVVAESLTDLRVRNAVGLEGTDRPAFTPITCADALSPDIRKELGPGSPPKQRNGSGELTGSRRSDRTNRSSSGPTQPHLDAKLRDVPSVPQTTAEAMWITSLPNEQQILSLVGAAADAIDVVDQTLGEWLRIRFDTPGAEPMKLAVLASQLPDTWLPRVSNVQFRRMPLDAAVREFSQNCLRIASIRSITLAADTLGVEVEAPTLDVNVEERSRCSSSSSSFRLQKPGARWELAPLDGLRPSAFGARGHCGCS